MEGGLHLLDVAAEFDGPPPGGNFRHLKSLGLEPARDGVDILPGRAELLPELFRREPRMVTRRSGILLVCQELRERGFLFRAAFETQQDPLHGQGGRRTADSRSHRNQRMDRAR